MSGQRPAHPTGFTLLELLIVLVVIGIMSSFAVLSVGTADRDKPLAKETQRLLALMRMASEESVQRTEQLGLFIDNDSYRFLRYDQNAWQPLDDDLFRERSLPENLIMTLVLEGRPIVLEDPMALTDDAKKDEKDKKEKIKPPQIIFLSSGEISPFTLTLSEQPGDALKAIKSVGDGTFTIDGDADAKAAPK